MPARFAPAPSDPIPFTAPERELLRRELCRHFGEDPRAADGLIQKGAPKLPPAIQSMQARGLVMVQLTERGPRAVFTEAGLAGLRRLLQDRRAMDPARFAHLRRELGLEADEGANAGSHGGARPDRLRLRSAVSYSAAHRHIRARGRAGRDGAAASMIGGDRP